MLRLALADTLAAGDLLAVPDDLVDPEATMIRASAIAYGLNIELSFDEDASRVRLSFGD